MLSKTVMLASAAALVAGSISVSGAAAKTVGHFTMHAIPGVQQGFFFPHHVPAHNLYAINAEFVVQPPGTSPGGVWPCFGPGTTTCSTNTVSGGVVLGVPFYSWPLSACDDSTTTVSTCGQINWFYEDDTADNTNHLVIHVTAKQGTHVIADSGNIDFGPNPFGNNVIVFSGGLGFGTIGNATGPNNGWCGPTAWGPGQNSGSTCVNPAFGATTITLTTTVGLKHITQTAKIYLFT